MSKYPGQTIKILAAIFALLLCKSAFSQMVYAYSFGVSLNNTVVPGSLVDLRASFKNTGNQTIRFAPSFPGGPPSQQGGSVPSEGFGFFGGWHVLDSGFTFGDFFSQFAGVNVSPGESFDFIMATFTAPSNLPLGSMGFVSCEFGMAINDHIIGNLRGPSGPTFDYTWFNNIPILTFTIGVRPSESNPVFYEGLVVDLLTGAIVSRPPVGPVPVPESGTLLPMCCILGFSIVLSIWRRRHKT